MKGLIPIIRRLSADQRGQMTLEWALILAAVAIPLYGVLRLCLSILSHKYQFITYMNSMPFP